MPSDLLTPDTDPATLHAALRSALHEKAVAEQKAEALAEEVTVLLARISELTTKLARATNRPAQMALELELKVLQERLSNHATERFGSTSERRPRDKDGDAKASPRKQSAHGGKRTDQPELLREEQVCLLEPADCCCPSCGDGLRVMANQFETSEMVVSVQREFRVLTEKRQKYRCGTCGHIDTALGRPKLVPGGRYDLSFVAQVAIDKYLDHLPLERQVRRMQRRGLKVTSQALWDQLHALYLVLLPTLLMLKARVLAAPLVHADESPWRMMRRKGSDKWWLWAICTADTAFYAIGPSRGADAAKDLLEGYDGILVADGYNVYGALAQLRTRSGTQLDLDGGAEVLPDFSLVACWMHARRFFFKASKSTPTADELLDLVAELYRLDKATRAEASSPDQLHELRQQHLRPVIDQIDAWRQAQRALPRSQFDKGLNYLATHWAGLTRFLDDPQIPLDNGDAERAIRGPVVGRKNHQGSRSPRGATVTAAMYSLVETCRRVGVDPHAYLLEAARRGIETPGSVFLPHDFAADTRDGRD